MFFGIWMGLGDDFAPADFFLLLLLANLLGAFLEFINLRYGFKLN